MTHNPCAERLAALSAVVQEKGLDLALVFNQANICALTGIDCDSACLVIRPTATGTLLTDFRYTAAIERLAPWLTVGDIERVRGKRPFTRAKNAPTKIGYESSISHARFLKLEKAFPGAEWTDLSKDVAELRAVKTLDELTRIRAAAKLNDEIWADAQAQFKPGMTEREMARLIRHVMIEKGDGEAFDTIVCVGENAAECHHVPDDTVWNGRTAVLVDMGVKLNGVCSDLTRNILPARPSPLYKKVYRLVLEANRRAIAAARPGMSVAALDRVARTYLTDNGFGKAFGHSLGHGVGLEIHEAPAVSRRSKMTLKPGMVITIEPGIYLPENLGVRIEDLIVITEDGCEVLSHAVKQAQTTTES